MLNVAQRCYDGDDDDNDDDDVNMLRRVVRYASRTEQPLAYFPKESYIETVLGTATELLQ